MLSKGAAFCFAFGPDLSPFEIPPGLSVSNQIDVEGQEYLLLCNGSPKAGSHGITGGLSIRLPNAVETEASNRHVTIKIVARAANEMQSRFALAYSTNEVGNSGWRWFDATPVWSVYPMEWDVPMMRTGNGDFIGILPDVEGNPALSSVGWPFSSADWKRKLGASLSERFKGKLAPWRSTCACRTLSAHGSCANLSRLAVSAILLFDLYCPIG